MSRHCSLRSFHTIRSSARHAIGESDQGRTGKQSPRASTRGRRQSFSAVAVAALHKLFTPVTVAAAESAVDAVLLFSLTHFRCVCFGFAFCPLLLLLLVPLLLLLLEPLLLVGSSPACCCWSSSFDGVPGLDDGGSGVEVDVVLGQDTVPVAVAVVEGAGDADGADAAVGDDPAKVILTPL